MSELLSWIEWVLLPALMGFVAMFLWHFFRDPYVQVIAEVEVIEVYENYTPPGLREGDYKHITLDVVLIPSKPVTVSEVRLILSGKQFDATVFSYNPITGLEITPFSKIRIDTKTKLTLFFDAQNECRTKTNKAQVIAVANNINRCSEPFIIKLDGEYRHMSNIMRRSG